MGKFALGVLNTRVLAPPPRPRPRGSLIIEPSLEGLGERRCKGGGGDGAGIHGGKVEEERRLEGWKEGRRGLAERGGG